MLDGLSVRNKSSRWEEAGASVKRLHHSIVERCDVTQYRNEIISLFQREGNARFADRFDWYYRSHGQGIPISWILRNEKGKICGLCSVTMRVLRYGDTIVKAGVSGNLIVDRTSGLYLGAFSLVRAMMSLVEDGEIDILVGSPNHLSQPVFQRMGFRLIDVWESQAMIYRSRSLLRVRFGIPGMLASPMIDLGAAARRAFFRQSLAHCRHFRLVEMHENDLQGLQLEGWKIPRERLAICASTNYLAWRFLRDPVTPCDLRAVLNQSGEPCAYLACRHVANRILVADCAVNIGQISSATAIACLCRQLEAQQSGIWVTTLRSSPLSNELSSCGFVTIRTRGRRSFAPLVGYWLPKHPLSEAFARSAAWDLFPGFNDVLS